MPPKKIKCSFKDCKVAAQRISGDCAFCNGHFCNNHRLLEDHKCSNLEDVSIPESQWWLLGLSEVLDDPEQFANLLGLVKCKKEAYEQNALQLNKERTQVIKGV
jgi:hypothetical protein